MRHTGTQGRERDKGETSSHFFSNTIVEEERRKQEADTRDAAGLGPAIRRRAFSSSFLVRAFVRPVRVVTNAQAVELPLLTLFLLFGVDSFSFSHNSRLRFSPLNLRISPRRLLLPVFAVAPTSDPRRALYSPTTTASVTLNTCQTNSRNCNNRNARPGDLRTFLCFPSSLTLASRG